jgi:hypothetical protein
VSQLEAADSKRYLLCRLPGWRLQPSGHYRYVSAEHDVPHPSQCCPLTPKTLHLRALVALPEVLIALKDEVVIGRLRSELKFQGFNFKLIPFEILKFLKRSIYI